MAKINILDSSIYNLIAAGEVVEKPASVVKEFVENSIDAGATDITIEIKDSVTSFIQVSDNGCGIDEADFKSAFLPHATSKIKTSDDLEKIGTLGFRGEALASIASVSKVTLVSKTADAELASIMTVSGGEFGEISKTGAKQGTTITVNDLFYCVPARAKFLRKNKTEEQEITSLISRIVLAHPEINFTYIVDGKKVISSLGTTAKEALYSIYGKEAVNETLEVSAKRDNVSVFGFVGKPTFSKSNRTYQTLIINGRYVVNLTVQTAVSNAYGDFLMKRQYPFFVLYLTVPYDEIDVNVHPNKLDVRFLNTSLIYSVVFEAVSRGLHDMDYVKEVNLESRASSSFSGVSLSSSVKKTTSEIDKAGVNLNPFSASFDKMDTSEKSQVSDIVIDSIISNSSSDGVKDNFGFGSKLLERINASVVRQENEPFNSSGYELSSSSQGQAQNTKASEQTQKVQNDDYLAKNNDVFDKKYDNFSEKYQKIKGEQIEIVPIDFKIVGKIFNTYLIVEWGDNIYLFDQHAVHERLRYEKLKEEVESGKLVIQPLLVPYVLTLSPEDEQIISANIEAIKSIGFDIDEFGDGSFKISAVPAIVSEVDFNEFFSMFLAEKINKNKITKTELIKDSLMQMACKSAVKGGDDLSKNEINKLLLEMSSQNITLFCPHGRPVVVRITKNEVEKWFKRIV